MKASTLRAIFWGCVVSVILAIWSLDFAGLQHVKDLLESQFIAALVGSLAGAMAGALAAGRIADRSKRREELLKELQAVRHAVSLAHSICSSALDLKADTVGPLCNEHARILQRLDSPLANSATGANIPLAINTPKVFPPSLPINELLEICLERLALDGRGGAVVIALHQTYQTLTSVMQERNDFVQKVIVDEPDPKRRIAMCFGLPLKRSDMHAETRTDYPDSLRAMTKHLDALIFFSDTLGLDLRGHGKLLLNEWRQITDDPPPKLIWWDHVVARQRGLLPSIEQYPNWAEDKWLGTSELRGAPA